MNANLKPTASLGAQEDSRGIPTEDGRKTSDEHPSGATYQ